MCKILYGDRSEESMRITEVLMSIHVTCEQRNANPYHFFRDYLNGEMSDVLESRIPVPAITP